MQMAEVSWVVYWVTVVVSGGSVVRMAFGDNYKLSDSACSPHELRIRWVLVTSVPHSLMTSQSSVRVSTRVLILWSPSPRASMRWRRVGSGECDEYKGGV